MSATWIRESSRPDLTGSVGALAETVAAGGESSAGRRGRRDTPPPMKIFAHRDFLPFLTIRH